MTQISAKWGSILHQALERIIELEEVNHQLVETKASNKELIERLRKELGQARLDLIAIQGKQTIDGETTE